MNLSDLLERIPQAYFVSPLSIDEDLLQLELATESLLSDSRQVKPGDVFVALKGVSVDGHDFIPGALDNGAVVVIGETALDDLTEPKPQNYIQVTNSRDVLGWGHAALLSFPAQEMTLIGITGTDGKTTVTNLLYHILLQAGVKVGMVSTVNAQIGSRAFDTGLHVTTPDAPQVQKLLRQMQESGVTHAILEVTSHGLAQGRLAGCEFDIALVTNITHEHLDFHGSWDAYAKAKAILFQNVAKGGIKTQQTKTSILNMDDEASYQALKGIIATQNLVYSIGRSDADVCAEDVEFTPAGLQFTLRVGEDAVEVRSSLVGMYNVSNILGASSAAIAMGVSLDDISAGVTALAGVPGRMERLNEGQGYLALVDFAHTPNALLRTLETARGMTSDQGRVIVIFGSAGLRDLAKRRMMGEVAGAYADKIVITAEDPRTESLDSIMRDIAAGVESGNRVENQDYWCVEDRGAAIRFAVDMARKGDIVLACGKGHEQSMCFGETEYAWDDRDALRTALRGGVLSTLPTAKV